MNKAEEKGYEAYPVSFYEGTTVDVNEMPRGVFIEGYHQAEKDNELTWENMFDIFRLVNEVLDDFAEGKTKKEVGEEVLKRFKYLRNERHV